MKKNCLNVSHTRHDGRKRMEQKISARNGMIKRKKRFICTRTRVAKYYTHGTTNGTERLYNDVGDENDDKYEDGNSRVVYVYKCITSISVCEEVEN